MSFPWLIGLVAVLLAGASVWVTARRTDRFLRAELLQEGRMVAQAIDLRFVAALSGTVADLASPDYLRLKERLTLIRNAKPQNRFLYLMGRKPDGEIFFFVDSEPASSKDYSPPGQIFEEAPEPVRRAFATRGELVAGPAVDRWGAWVSALIPLFDPKTGRLLAVFGMDIDASDWKWTVMTRSALPAALAFLALLLGLLLIVMRRAGLNVRASEERFRTLVEGAPEAIFVQSGDRFVYLNSAAVRLFGASRAEDLLGKDFLERIASEYHEAIRERCRLQRQTGKPAPLMEQEYLRLDGSRIPVESTAVPFRFQGRDAHLVFVRDITARKQAEIAFRRSESRFSEAFHASPALMAISRLDDGRFLDVNDAFLAKLGYSRDEVIGKSSINLEILVEADRAALVGRLDESGHSPTTEVKVRAKNGALIPGLFSGRRVLMEEGMCWLTVLVDITERKRMEALMQRQIEDLRRWHEVTLGREERIIELKREVNDLAARVGEPPRYESPNARSKGGI
jgi:PAS domain S-box-containing protein